MVLNFALDNKALLFHKAKRVQDTHLVVYYYTKMDRILHLSQKQQRMPPVLISGFDIQAKLLTFKDFYYRSPQSIACLVSNKSHFLKYGLL